MVNIFQIAKLFSYTWTMGVFLCKSVHYMQSVSAICSVLTLTAMSMERYEATLNFTAFYYYMFDVSHKIFHFVYFYRIFYLFIYTFLKFWKKIYYLETVLHSRLHKPEGELRNIKFQLRNKSDFSFLSRD